MLANKNFILKYSTIYDKRWALALNKKYNRQNNIDKYESFIKGFLSLWDSKESDILEAISYYSGLRWNSKSIEVYFVSELMVSGFSDPLTIRMSDDYNKVVITLIHEAVHRILEQHKKEMIPIYQALNQKNYSENKSTNLHIIVNAVTDKVAEKIFGKNEANRIKKCMKECIGLKRAYELLENIRVEDDVLESIRSYCS